ncbi:hypothetical protein [Rhodoferax sediminis]|uniref:Uncharacterized protein n=1 Tax=Rhodoferax aquaticus TaxID=2527691 RepID=A0A515ER60_9BURK|nr:hypothetical protein EXZ61_13570 [Rhodoferax aquaticus]
MPHPREHLSAAAIAAMPSPATAHPLNPNSVRLKKSLGDAVGLTQMGGAPDHRAPGAVPLP